MSKVFIRVNKKKSIYTDAESLLKKKLVKFLKKENVLKQFCHNMEKNGTASLTFNKGVKLKTISSAFTWGETKEGRDYWDALDIKFENK
tara:strand:+ start:1269 stop:1535 length:267 start_codon:yes stop_codon:yes gene_type:complete